MHIPYRNNRSENWKMNNFELKQKAITFIQQLSNERLEAALEYLSYLYDIDNSGESQDISTDPVIFKDLLQDHKVRDHQDQKDNDPLLALVGTLKFDNENISDNHDEYIGDVLLSELHGNEYE